MRVVVDLELCQGHAVCQGEAPEVFRVVDRPGSYEPAIMGIGCLIALSFGSIGWIRDERGGASGGTP